jgi:hypothetical protein
MCGPPRHRPLQKRFSFLFSLQVFTSQLPLFHAQLTYQPTSPRWFGLAGLITSFKRWPLFQKKMVIVRLQVHVLPWQDHTAADGVRPARQDPILPWNEPCDEHATIQTLAEKIVARFKSIHVGKG